MKTICKKHVKEKACKLHVEAEMNSPSKMHIHETMYVNNRMEMNKACSTCVHRRKEL